MPAPGGPCTRTTVPPLVRRADVRISRNPLHRASRPWKCAALPASYNETARPWGLAVLAIHAPAVCSANAGPSSMFETCPFVVDSRIRVGQCAGPTGCQSARARNPFDSIAGLLSRWHGALGERPLRLESTACGKAVGRRRAVTPGSQAGQSRTATDGNPRTVRPMPTVRGAPVSQVRDGPIPCHGWQ